MAQAVAAVECFDTLASVLSLRTAIGDMPEDRFKAGLPRNVAASEQPAGRCPQSRGKTVMPVPWLCAMEAQCFA